jgi:PAS domain S-box-containing protein
MLWALGTFLVGCGFGFIAFQESVSPWLGIVVANTVIAAGWSLLAAGMRSFVGKPAFPTRAFAVFALLGFGMAIFTFLVTSVSVRIVLISFYAAISFAECGILSLRSGRFVPGPMPRVSAGSFFAFALLFPLRAVSTIYSPVSSLFETSALTELSFEVANLSLVVLPIALILLRNACLRAELEHGEALYRGIVENAGVGIYQSTWEGQSILINAAGAALFGYESSDALFKAFGGTSLPIYADARDRERFLALIGEKGHVEDFRVASRRADGSSFWLSINATLVRGAGDTRILTGTLTDITARLREEDDLKRARDEKTARLRELQHRVKNGMSVIASLAALKAEQFQDEASKEAFEDLQREVGALASLYDILYRSGESAEIRLDEYVGSLVEALRASHGAEERGIEVRTSLNPVSLNLKRAESVGLAIVELVSDAFKHAFPGGRSGTLLISLRREGESIVLEVADDGIGLPEGFSPEEASGYGVSMVALLARQLGGRLEVVAGPGARFALRFPFESPATGRPAS